MNAILFNGQIYPQVRIARPSLVVITGNRITELGNDVKAANKKFPRHRLINLQGRTVIPGLVDSHTHLYFWAISLGTVHLDGVPTFAQALQKIKAHARKNPKDKWIVGDGWSPDRWEPHHLPTAAELDSVTGDRPAALFSKDQHMVWANSKALQLAGIDENYPDPEGGWIDREDHTRKPTGILREIPGYFPVFKLINRPRPEQVVGLWRKAVRIAYRRGVTGFHSMDGPEAMDFYSMMHERGRLGFRVHYYYPSAMLDEIIDRSIKSGDGDDTLRIGGIKIFTDGSLGAQTALMKKPYRGTKNRLGVETIRTAELHRLIIKATRHNLACAIHAIGDRAVANVIDGFIKAGRGRELRHRIEHLQIISPGDIPRLKKTGVIASMQPSHCPSDRELVAAYWGARGRHAFKFKTLLGQKIPLAFGSDCPIEPLDPLAGICAAVNRTGYGERGGRFYPEERLTVARALAGFTTGAAYAAGREDFSGKIAPGYQADLAILDDNIFTMPPADIYRTQVAATIFDGKFVFRGTL
ncbi:MAG: amidohydrolase [FCB group bacterium]|nr:amidohydrolase [FCB group bacterium]